MTRQERKRPEILNTSRRKRIANGSGQGLGEVNDLLKQFKMMKGMMDQFSAHGKGIVGKFKGMRALKRQMRGESVHDIMQDLGSSPALPGGVSPPGTAPPAAGARKKTLNHKDLRKKRKKERQRRKKARRR